jgi:hypothetical protein
VLGSNLGPQLGIINDISSKSFLLPSCSPAQMSVKEKGANKKRYSHKKKD